ncbi:MAG: O-antigen ligase family protein [Scytonema sp. PMC 1069.18]|nr:O-antigen ligase family protein [Scytonema sp. PMC 1069.18]MEC4882336.1 O-antigen ligase family protein [Scytonema sp. PMC 1070.18]
MHQLLTLKNHQVKKLELGITVLLFFYYLGPNVPQSVIQAGALFGYLTVPLLIIRYWKRFFWVATRDLPLLFLTVSVPISVLWSTSPEFTIAHSRAFLCSTAFGIYLATRYTAKEQMRLLIWWFGIYTFVNLMLPLFLPSYGVSRGAWTGLTKYKNSLAATMVIATTLFLDIGFYNRKYRWTALIGATIAFIILVLSKGKGSLGIFIGMLPLLPVYKIAKQEYKLRTFLGICALSILAVIILATVINLEFIVVDLLEKDMGFNGRESLWDYLIERGLERPWLGYGYAGFWTNPIEGLGVAIAAPWLGGAGEGGGNAHSSYIETFLQLGWLGLSLLALSLFMLTIRVVLLLGLTRQIEFFWILQFLLVLAMLSYFDSMGFLSERNLLWVLYVSSACSTAIHLNRIFKTGNKFVNLQFENRQPHA